jgi:hypothetical protein
MRWYRLVDRPPLARIGKKDNASVSTCQLGTCIIHMASEAEKRRNSNGVPKACVRNASGEVPIWLHASQERHSAVTCRTPTPFRLGGEPKAGSRLHICWAIGCLFFWERFSRSCFVGSWSAAASQPVRGGSQPWFQQAIQKRLREPMSQR